MINHLPYGSDNSDYRATLLSCPNSLRELSIIADIHQNFPFVLQSRVNPHFHSQQEQELRPEPNPNKSQGYSAGRVAIRNSGRRLVRLKKLPADNSFKVLPLTLQSEIKQHQIISLIKGNF